MLRLPLLSVVAAALSGAPLGCADELPDAPELFPTALARQALAPVNDLPPPQTTNEDTRLTFAPPDNPLTVSDADNVNTQLQITVTNGTFTTPGAGGVVVTGNGTPDVILTGPIDAVNTALEDSYYQPGANFSGDAQLQMHSQDTNGESSTDVLAITVTPFNDPPVLSVPAATQNATEDTPFPVSVSVNDVDVGAGEVRVSLTSSNGTVMTLPGTTGLTFTSGDGDDDAAMTFTGTLPNVNSALNGLTITPPANFVGASRVDISVDDLGQTGGGDPGVDFEVVNLNWRAVNDAPVNTVPGAQTIAEDTTLTFSAASGTALTTSDVDATTTLLQVTLSATNGTLTLGSAGGVSFVSGDGSADASMVFTGTLAQLNAALAGTVFTPATNFAGTAVVTLSTNDLGNSGTGGARTDQDQVSITVEAGNDAPVNTVPGPQDAAEDVPLTFANLARITVADVDAPQLQVTLAAENGTLTLPTKGGLVFQAGDGTADASMTFTGTTAAINTAINGLVFLSTQDYSGSGSLTITTSDRGATGVGGELSDTDVIDIAIAPVNDPPNAAGDVLAVDEDDGATELLPLVNDTIAPDVNETLSVVDVTQPANGSVVLVSADRVAYTPNADFYGTDTFNYTVSDGVLTDVAMVTVTVAPVNDPPTAVDDDVVIQQETSTVLGLLANDTAAPDIGETLTITEVTVPANGTAVIVGNGTGVQYTPNDGFSGSDTFGYTISDGALTASAAVNVTVTAVNTTPVNTLPAPQTTSEDVPLLFSSGNGSIIRVADGNNTSLTVLVQVTNGTFSLSTTAGLTNVTANGTSFVSASGPITALNTAFENAKYTPSPNYAGPATLTLTSRDSQNNFDEDSLAITVVAINDGPVNSVPTNEQAATEDTPRSFSNLSVSDADVGAGNVRVTLAASNGTVVTLGAVEGLAFDAGDGVSDATVVFAGSLTDVNSALNGLTVVPPANYIGTSTLVITSNDLGNVGAGGPQEDSDTITIRWAAANDPPVNRLPEEVSTDEDTPLVFTEAEATEIRVSDQDAGGAPMKVTLSVTNGTLTLVDPSLVPVFDQGTGVADTTMTIRASLAVLNGTAGEDGALEGLVFTPTPGFAGTATLTMTTSDEGATGGGARTDVDVLPITVNAVNDPPVNTVPGPQTTPEDTALQFSNGTNNLVAVSDVDASTLQVSLSAENGTLTLATVSGLVFEAGDGVGDATLIFRGPIASINAALSGLRFLPTPDFSGVASLVLRSDDLGATGLGGAAFDEDTVEIFVSPVSDVPVVVNDAYTVDEDAPATSFDVLANDSTLPDLGETLTLVSVTAPTRGGSATITGSTVTYQPLANFYGTERFDYVVSDGTHEATARVTITVNSVNDLPSAGDDTISLPRNSIAYLLPVLENDTDVEGALVITATTTPSQGTLELDATQRELRYTPTAGYFGPDAFEYTVTDGDGATASATVSLTVEEGVNALPAAVADAATVAEDSAGQTIDVLANDEGLADGPLVVAIVTAPENGTATVLPDNRVRYQPSPDYWGTDSLRYSVTDADGESSEAAVVITVNPVDDLPSANSDQATTEEDTSVNIVVLANDAGLADGPPVVTIASEPTSGTAVVESDNSITFEPAAHFFGQTFFTYSVSDGDQSSTALVTVLVTPVADPPEAMPDTAATRAGEAVDIDVLANDVDPDGDTLTIVSVSEPANGTASIVGGQLRYTPADGFEGTDQLEYTIDDGSERTAVGAVVIGVGLDEDEDGLIDLDELELGTDPANPDTDGDLIPDGVEVHVMGTDPLDDDTDDDGLLDGNEDANQDGVVDEGETDPLDRDTDNDLISDGVEVGLAEPQGNDTDPDLFEADADPSTTTDPTNPDTDGDGVKDGQEDLNQNGRVDIAEQDPTVDDVEPPPPPPEDDGGCRAVPGDSALAAFALAALLWRLRRRRPRSAP